MDKKTTFTAALFISLLTFSLGIATATNQGIALNRAYSKNNGNYDVVVKDIPGVRLALYLNDKNPVYANTNKSVWATFHNVKLTNTAKISFTRVFGQGMSNQKPINYVRYARINNNDVAFTKSQETTAVTPAPATTSVTPAATSSPTAAPAASTPVTSCTPLTDSGGCYKPGEYCRDSDRGSSGRTSNGESITCEDNDGWRWEPS